jgi:LmbE family N-acetylglucosaminyl deacetylase/SAM-dependent methyltransferase
MVKFESTQAGTSAEDWASSGRVAGLATLPIESISELVVIAAHPDDETLGAGGLIARARTRNIPVRVVVTTRGEASHPHSDISRAELGQIRSQELRAALEQLSTGVEVIELDFPDGHTDEHRDDMAAALAAVIPAGATIASPWRGDGHRDHRIVGELCAAIAHSRNSTLLEYPIWMWHWAAPGDAGVPWDDGRVLALSNQEAHAKAHAQAQYRSQMRGNDGVRPVLMPEFLEHFLAPREVFFLTEGSRTTTKTKSYFDELYESNDDPWRLSTRWYEARKRAISVESLPSRRFQSALEIGCSVGELTALLAERADRVLGLDISVVAVRAAKARTRELHNVRVLHADATRDFPDELFDLIVLSEVGYYWDRSTLRAMVGTLREHLTPDGVVVACHWRHPVGDYPLAGDEVHEVLHETSGLHRLVFHQEEDFALEVLSVDGRSVARREGLVS